MKYRNIFRKNIFCLDNQLSPLFCEHLIKKFEDDDLKHGGVTGSGFNNTIKQSTDLCISNGDTAQDWKAEDAEVSLALSNMLRKHNMHIEKHFPGCQNNGNMFDTGHQIQRTTPGGFYDWHSDAYDSRQFTYIFYLNDVKGGGGYTEFCDGTRIQARAGRALIFPATVQFYHRGVAPKKDLKYILTGWVYTPFSGDPEVLKGSGLGHLIQDNQQHNHEHHGNQVEDQVPREID